MSASRSMRSERLEDGGWPALLDTVGEGGWDIACVKADGSLAVVGEEGLDAGCCGRTKGSRSRRRRGLGCDLGEAALRRGVRGAWGCEGVGASGVDDDIGDDDEEKKEDDDDGADDASVSDDTDEAEDAASAARL